ncbi:MAG TPA: DUF4343 domain-containing protein [Cyanobacteria bacterium UBA11149]|nr:DUF4343 domain-containing protein [Cyanobacteria bacterium UBA11367]HBE59645.1 DUF4343 domain-containing protein [Cyanobacteria bacterium UBA11366]HBK64551.1 DUF4343 domain-containing protein [Cyanobacteria bacterium UBA11166]HBR75628.1 DUF4343 domain-containing protein [Cyanobacteria bacterium UBA11159]HBS72713.1 DUF4343 domain-containing protein [Cyanobacteria bacterium UBA11153]HBW90670.1 DUF4343 domain-containing protein [Cyanobacteria bacterium UBA11149]HCA98022.1 DUF4343 domain-conta
MEAEIRSLYNEFQFRQIPVQLFVEKHLFRKKLQLNKNILVAGYIPVVLNALCQLGIEPPKPNDYPPSLQPFLGRRIWQSTVRDIIRGFSQSYYPIASPIFVKPSGKLKRFTGRVFESERDLFYLEGVSKHLPVYCSEVVRWLSEYRVFAIKSKIVGIQHYSGDPSISINEDIVVNAIECLEKSGEATAAYAIDFGVIENNRTALVELNDGFAIGSYGLDKTVYTDLIITRWCELTGYVTD